MRVVCVCVRVPEGRVVDGRVEVVVFAHGDAPHVVVVDLDVHRHLPRVAVDHLLPQLQHEARGTFRVESVLPFARRTSCAGKQQWTD